MLDPGWRARDTTTVARSLPAPRPAIATMPELLAQARDAYHELGMTTWARRACEDGAGG